MFQRMTVLSGCGAALTALASGGCAPFLQDVDGPSPVYGASLPERERVVVVHVPAGARGPLVLNLGCPGAQLLPLGFKPSPYEDEPEPVAYPYLRVTLVNAPVLVLAR